MKLPLLPRPVFNSIPNPTRSIAIFAAITALFFVVAIDQARAQDSTTNTNEFLFDPFFGSFGLMSFGDGGGGLSLDEGSDGGTFTSTAATGTYTTNSSQAWDQSSGMRTAGTAGYTISQYSFGTDTSGGQVNGGYFSTGTTIGSGTAEALQVGQTFLFRMGGEDDSGRTGVQTGGRIGFSLGSGTDIFNGGSGIARATNDSLVRVEFIGGDASASFTGDTKVTGSMPGFGDFKSGQFYAIEVLSSDEFILRYGTTGSANTVVYNMQDFAGSGGSIGKITFYNLGQNMASIFSNIVVSNSSYLNFSNNTGENNTISGVISDNGGTANAAVKNGVGTVVFSGNNTYTGATTISNGTLAVTLNNALGTTAAGTTISSGATLDFRNINYSTAEGVINNGGTIATTTGSSTFAGAVTLGANSSYDVSTGATLNQSGAISDGAGSFGITKNGAGQLNLSVSNSYDGTTTVSAGTLEAQNADALGSTAAGTSVTSGATLKLWNATGFTSAAEALTINGSGVGSAGALLNEGGSNTYAGAITLGSASRINASTNTTLTLDVASGSAISGSHALTFGGNGNIVVNDNVAVGANLITKDGNGRVTISGTQTASGGITVSSGTLVYNASNSGSGSVTVNSGGTLAGTGSLGATTINSGGTMNPGSSPGTQTYATLTWGAGGNYNWQILDADGAAGTGYDTFVSSGAFAITANSGSKFNINLWSLSSTGPDVNGNANNFNSATNYTWTLGTFGSISGFSTDAFTINTGAANGTGGFANSFGGTFSINTNSTQLLLVYSAPVSNYTVTVASGAVDQGAGAGITGGTNQFTGVGASLTKLGAGTLIMTNTANDYTGSTTIAEGTVSINVASPSGSAGALGNASSAVAVGTSTNAVATGFDFGAAVDNARSLNVIAGSGGVGSRTISTSFGSGTATQSGAVSISTNTAITAASGSTLLVSGALSGTGGANINGAGAVILSNNNTGYSGTVTLSSGAILRAANNGALGTGGLTLSGGTLTTDGANARTLANNITIGGNVAFGDGSGTGNLTLNGTVGLGGSVRTLTVANNTTLGGAIGGTAGNGLTKAGNGTLTLSGANTFDGAVTINAGRLNVGGSSAIGNSAAVTVASGATFGLNALEEIGSLTGAGNVALGGLLIVGNNGTSTTYSGVMSGTDGFVKKGAGTTTLSGANNYSGETFIVGGAALYSVAQGGSFTNAINLGETNGTVSASLLLGATLNNPLTVRSGSSNNTLAVASSGAGAVTYGGNVNLFNNNFTIGQTTGGTGSVTFGTSTNTFFLGGDGGETVRILNLIGSHTIGAEVTGGANNRIAVAGGGTLTLSRANTFSGGVQLREGTLLVGNDAALGTGTFQVQFDQPGTRTLASSSSAGYTLTNNVNIFNDVTIGQATGGTGTLNLSGTVYLGDEVGSNRVVTIAENTLQQISGSVTGNRGIVKQGAGTLSLSGANTSTGGFFIDGGMLNLNGGSIAFSGMEVGGGVNGSTVAGDAAALRVTSGTFSQSITVNGNTNGSGVAGSRAIEFANATGSASLSGGITAEKTFTASVAESAATGVLSGAISGAGGLTKTGNGTLTLSGAAANSYSGVTTVSAGTLNLNKSSGNAIAGATTISSGAVLLLSGSNQVDNGASDLVTLSGGTIRRGGNVSEVFGNLSVTTASFLDYGAANSTGTLSFGTYTPSALLTVQNFLPGNVLTFGSDLTTSINNGSLFSLGAQGFTSSWSSGTSTFTITAIPEPSTYVAAAGLLAMFLWPVRRRLLKGAKSILGLRAPARDCLVH